jgi:hypothetical protein
MNNNNNNINMKVSIKKKKSPQAAATATAAAAVGRSTGELLSQLKTQLTIENLDSVLFEPDDGGYYGTINTGNLIWESM